MEKCGRVRQAIDDKIIQRMRIACRITKVTDTHSEYEILFYHGNIGYGNARHCCLVLTLPGLPARCNRINTAISASHCCTCFFFSVVCTCVSVIPADEIPCLVAMTGSILRSALIPPV